MNVRTKFAPVQQLTQPLTKTLKATTKITSNLILITLLSLSPITLNLLPTNKAEALTPPDTCFNFDSGTNTITDYYDNENNDSGQPACPRDVGIPDTISGEPVTTIDDGAFSSKQLTSVTIPNSVTTIGNSAFFANNIDSVTLGSNVTTIGTMAFWVNKIKSVNLPDSLSSLDFGAFGAQNEIGQDSYSAFLSGDPVIVQTIIDAIWATQLFTNNPGVVSDEVVTEAMLGGSDYNQNGSTDDILSVQLINPASISVSFKDNNGNNITPPNNTPTLYTGYDIDTHQLLTSYLVKDNPLGNLNYYYRSGDNPHLTITPPDIDGYITPTAQAINTNLAKGTNNITFTYQVDNNTDSDSDGIPDSIENNAPNNGDANNDGILDKDQANVSYLPPTTTPNGTTTKPIALELDPSCSLTNALNTDQSSTNDPAYAYTTALIDFKANCTTPGFTTTVKLYFYDIDNTNYTLRKYNPDTNGYSTIPNANLNLTTIDNHKVLISSYQVTDGGILDLDSQANGTIVDPVGLATQIVGIPNTGL